MPVNRRTSRSLRAISFALLLLASAFGVSPAFGQGKVDLGQLLEQSALALTNAGGTAASRSEMEVWLNRLQAAVEAAEPQAPQVPAA